MSSAGVYEFIFGGLKQQQEDLLKFWEVLGFTPLTEGSLPSQQASELYGHRQSVTSIRLGHSGCASYGTGYVRLQLWDVLRNQGLANSRPIQPGSRWMGMYTHDILQLRDSFDNAKSRREWNLWISPLVHAPLAQPAPEVTYYQGFVGLRETLVFGDDFRLAFIQRGGFDRPGFGTFDDGIVFKNTEGSHANVVQPSRSFSTEFYKSMFDFESAPYGEAHDSGEEAPTIAALNLKPNETFRVERTRAIDCPTGLLQVYSSYADHEDYRDLSRPGSRNLCCYSICVSDLAEFSKRIEDYPEATISPVSIDEFGNESVCFQAPDGYSWMACAK